MTERRRNRWRSSAAVQERARQLRATLTPAESRLWQRLRGEQLSGFAFRRQYPIGPFIVDFYCPSARLIVELDGDVHGDRADYDAQRSRWIEEHRRCRVLRFTNDEVLDAMDAVLETIYAALRERGP
jgi:very-short-patch-repair endonuclease